MARCKYCNAVVLDNKIGRHQNLCGKNPKRQHKIIENKQNMVSIKLYTPTTEIQEVVGVKIRFSNGEFQILKKIYDSELNLDFEQWIPLKLTEFKYFDVSFKVIGENLEIFIPEIRKKFIPHKIKPITAIIHNTSITDDKIAEDKEINANLERDYQAEREIRRDC